MTKQGCVFCDAFAGGSRVVLTTDDYFVILDEYPVNRGHALIITKRHVPDLFSLNQSEGEFSDAIELTKDYLDENFHPDGYNIGINCGEAAGQTIPHFHIHMIPRYKGDVENPRGGIRNFKTPLIKY